ncbi:MAG: PocR ligand-binding domain-containing protein [Clostridia bacterium]
MINKEQKDYGFELETVKKSIDAYSSSINMECRLVDLQGESLYHCNSNKQICKFCKKVQEILSQYRSCQNVHLYGSYQAERFNGKFIFFCPMGLIHWASPIIIDGTLKGGLLGGPVIAVRTEELLLDDIIRKNHIDEEYIEELKKYANEIPVVPVEQLNSFSELLSLITSHISSGQTMQYLEKKEHEDQEADISEYINYINTMGGSDSALQNYPLKKEEELLSLISLGDKIGSQKILNELTNHIFISCEGKLEIVKARVLELIVLLSRAALQGGADVEQIFGLNYRYMNQIHRFRTIEELMQWLSNIMTRFTDSVFNLADVKHVDVIFKAIDFVKHNYMKKISLEDVAGHVHLSASYFSKTFKEEMRCNFNTYLNQVRIEMSKKLLADNSLSLLDVSNLVGFEDLSYFSKVFKKIAGVTPGKFRESRGTI